jgi:hypothetical protein
VSGLPILGAFLIILMIAVLLWFAVGTQRNIRKGNDILRWLQPGLRLMGRRTRLRWLGSSAVQLNVDDAHEPFRQAEVVVVLEPRDVGVLWLRSRARGRRDFLILRGRLARSPRFELEAGDRRGWTGLDRVRQVDRDAWYEADWDEENVHVLHGPAADADTAREAWNRFAAVSGGVWRMSIRRESPHVEVHVLYPDMSSADAKEIFQSFRDVAKAVI